MLRFVSLATAAVATAFAADARAATREPPRARPAADDRGAGAGLAAHFHVDAEFRGETLHYVETDAAGTIVRHATMPFFWARGYEIHVDGLRSCWHPGAGTRADMSDAERRAVTERIVAWAEREQGVRLEVRGADW